VNEEVQWPRSWAPVCSLGGQSHSLESSSYSCGLRNGEPWRRVKVVIGVGMVSEADQRA
jgi:hypothetical protein